MYLTLLKSKIHCARVTEANLDYMGSITIDEALMETAGIVAGEQVHVVNNNNGERIVTYVIAGPRNSGSICLNGAAARKFQKDDVVIIMAYAQYTPEEARDHKPRVLFPDERNRVTSDE
ncbi:MAG: aspartate 1-decarboxylase [Alloprevotella sp.]|nr:aspartate 1-decarboxylase [Alloprevotella sp.]